MGLSQQIGARDFRIKVLVVCSAVFVVLAYFLLRYLFGGRRFLASGQADEERMLEQGEIELTYLQSVTWRMNADQTNAQATFSLGTLILAAVFVFEQRLAGFDALMFNLILAVFGCSVLACFVSLRFWSLALDAGGSVDTRVRYRRRAVTLQSAGWLTLVLAVVLSVMAVTTWLGVFFCLLGSVSVLYIFEYKARVSFRDQAEQSSLNDFQQGLDINAVYVKNQSQKPCAVPDELEILSWNIGRGYKPDEIASFINTVSPDIACLQEVDWGNERTGFADVVEILSQETQMTGYFGIEFFEIQTPYRKGRLAGGGVHGNAILTRLAPKRVCRVELPQQFDWSAPPRSKRRRAFREKRLGRRFALCADFESNEKLISICSVHLEDVDGGVAGRYEQLRGLSNELRSQNPEGAIIIAGDFNTLDNWIARLTDFGDASRPLQKPWHVSECTWWKTRVLPDLGYVDPFDCGDWTYKVAGVDRAKLDWIIARNCRIVDGGRGDFHSSNHRPVWARVRI